MTTTTDYVLVHLRLKAPQQTAPIYVNGWWTYDRMLPQYEMQWNPDRNEYEAALWLKQGYYSYQYLTEQPDGTFAPLPSEGNFTRQRTVMTLLSIIRSREDAPTCWWDGDTFAYVRLRLMLFYQPIDIQ